MRAMAVLLLTILTAACEKASPPPPVPTYRGDIDIVAHGLLKPGQRFGKLRYRGPLFLDDALMRCAPPDPSNMIGGDPDPPIEEVTCKIKPELRSVAALLRPDQTYIDLVPPNPMKIPPPDKDDPVPTKPGPVTIELLIGSETLRVGGNRILMTIEISVPYALFMKLNYAPMDKHGPYSWRRRGLREMLARDQRDVAVQAIALRRGVAY